MFRKILEIEINENTSDEDLEICKNAAQHTSDINVQRKAAQATVEKNRREQKFKRDMFIAQEHARVQAQRFQEAQITRLIEARRISDDQRRSLTESLTAASTMTIASSSAAEAGYEKTAKASDNLVLVINNYIESAADQLDISERQNEALELGVFELEQQAKAEGIPLTESFRCYRDFQDCMQAAKTPSEQWACRVILATCLGAELTKDLIKIG